MKIKIMSIFGSVKFEGDFNSIKEAVLAAFLRDADLSGADLRGANLRDADLSGADLRDADLRGANLRGADLRGANLRGANLRDADLRGANLRGANLRDADLSGADLRGADLSGADLSDADLSGADLRGAKNAEFAIASTRILPDGDIIGWKKCCDSVLVKVLIATDVKRSSAFGRKCRAASVKVLEVIGAKEGVSHYDSSIIYRKGETVTPKNPFSDDWQSECASGIHFFITKIEAENYSL